ncbi:MAG: hypothetical protein JNK53_00990 [Phycisphaerae bacterium]|nr:hypothetical protein [Phycisphaerae bacterium]
MANGAVEERWTHTAHILAMLVNVNRVKGRAAKPEDYMPTKAKPEVVHDVGVLKAIFCPHSP